jgi:Heterokaryon incompatibility protein (HET)
MLPASWQRGPLGLEIEQFLDLKGTGKGYTRAYANWARYRIISSSSSPHPKLFQLNSRLSLAQANSYGLLVEWWTGESQDPVLSEAARFAIEVTAGLGNVNEDDIQDPKVLQTSRDGTSAERPLFDPRLGESTYHGELFKLFLQEFFYYEDLDTKFLSTLQYHRQRCATLASCQRIAYSCLKTVLKPISPLSSLQIPGSEGSQCHDMPLSGPNQIGRIIGATIEPCPWLSLKQRTWLDGKESRDCLPFYLWDREARRTVKVCDLEELPEYLVVSHTWGRWRENSPPVSVKGVPWDVPRISRFDVQALPDMLYDTQFNTPYIWIDLFCIPQTGSDPVFIKIASDEIARQAAIFHGAAGGAIWLNDISTWEGLQSTIEWLALKFFIGSVPSQHELKAYLDVAFEAADVPTGLYDAYEAGGDPSTAGADPVGWFSSLWTLQEAFLRPDMWLFNRNWKALSVGDRTPVPLDALVALVQGYTNIEIAEIPNPSDHSNRAALERQFESLDFPAGYIELSGLLWSTGMDQLLDSSPLSTLILGNQRYCKSRRAHALMSVIGATEWFDSDESKADQFDDTPETGLVLGRYPLPFLTEVKRKLGALFFTSYSTDIEKFDVIRQLDASLASDIKGVGSILPFGTNSQVIKFRSRWQNLDICDHPSIECWEILQDGSIALMEAGITVPRDGGEDFGSIPARIMMPLFRSGFEGITFHETKDLYGWMKTYCPMQNILAVCLSYGPKLNEGIILEEIGIDSSVFVKVGNYFIEGEECKVPASSKVHWRIL